MSLPVPPLHDRRKTNRPFSQISFIEFFVAPLVFATVKVLAPLRGLQEELVINARLWMEEWQAEAQPCEEEAHSVDSRLRRLEERAQFHVASPVGRVESKRSYAVSTRWQSMAGQCHIERSRSPSASSASTMKSRASTSITPAEQLSNPRAHVSGV